MTIAAILAAAAPTLVPLAAQALQEAVNSGSMTADQANALWTRVHNDWTAAYQGWQAQVAADSPASPAA